MSRVLVVEDERHLANGLRFNLEAEGYDVETLETGDDALTRLAADGPLVDVLVLDVMLPGKDGFTVISELRRNGRFIPALMLTARGHPDDILKGFAAGADDYLTKPFELAILIARIRGLLRRRDWWRTGELPAPQPTTSGAREEPDRYTFGKLKDKTVDFNLLNLEVRGQRFPLTLMEANVLRYLIRHEGRPVSRKAMLEDVWDLQEGTDTRPIDNFIVRLRRYIEDDPTGPRHLLTVRGVGYRFIAVPEAQR